MREGEREGKVKDSGVKNHTLVSGWDHSADGGSDDYATKCRTR